MMNRPSRLVPAAFGLFFIAFAVMEIIGGKAYPQRGGSVILRARDPISFWVMTCTELAAGIFLIVMTWYGLKQKGGKSD